MSERAERPFYPLLNPPVEDRSAPFVGAALCLLLLPAPLGGLPALTASAEASRRAEPQCYYELKEFGLVGDKEDFFYNEVENPVHIHHFNATVLYYLDIDHEKLTFKFQGRHFRLTDVHGEVVKGILA